MWCGCVVVRCRRPWPDLWGRVAQLRVVGPPSVSGFLGKERVAREGACEILVLSMQKERVATTNGDDELETLVN